MHDSSNKNLFILLTLYLFLLLTNILIPLRCYGDQLIIEPDMGRKPIFQMIAAAHHRIQLSLYMLTDDAILSALQKQKRHGNKIQVLLEAKPYRQANKNNKAFHLMTLSGIKWHNHIHSIHFIHQKTLLIDHCKAMIMTFNLTKSTFQKDRNFALIMDHPQSIQDIAATFEADWKQINPTRHANATLLWSPETSYLGFLKFIQQAKQTIHIYAETLSDYAVIGMLARAAHRGVSIKIITSQKTRPKQYRYLQKAGILVHRSKAYSIHAKVMIIDQQKAILGSTNLTYNSLNYNRELAAITTDQQAIQPLNHTFQKDWNHSQPMR